MNWLLDLYRTNPTAQAIAVLSLVCVGGMALGGIAIRGMKLGTSGVLFVAIVVGHFYKPIEHETLEFVKEFGLILFVFCMGLQLGPGFFASLRHAGMRLNMLSLCIVFGGAAMAVALGWLLNFDGAAVLGIYSGATTNTPSLGAAQQTLLSFPDVSADRAAIPALAYAVTYPLGVIGIIVSMLGLKAIFRIDTAREVEVYTAEQRLAVDPVKRRTIIVENTNLENHLIGEIPAYADSGVVVARIRPRDATTVSAATRETRLHIGDTLLVVGSAKDLDQFQQLVGRPSQEDLITTPTSVTYRRVVLTNPKLAGEAIGALNLDRDYGVVPTRLVRGDTELTVAPAMRLKFGDILHLVGEADKIDGAAERLGNSLQALNETHFVPLFAGMSVGIALGTLPIALPGLPQPLRLGLAAGPLIVALIVGRIGHVGRLVWHMPRNANVAFREFGIALFLAAVGLTAGPKFFATAFSAIGLTWLVAGVFVTLVPLLVVGAIARIAFSANFVELTGLLAGGMTDPPALAFANGLCQSEAPSVSFATVYPLTMLMRILVAQGLTVVLCG